MHVLLYPLVFVASAVCGETYHIGLAPMSAWGRLRKMNPHNKAISLIFPYTGNSALKFSARLSSNHRKTIYRTRPKDVGRETPLDRSTVLSEAGLSMALGRNTKLRRGGTHGLDLPVRL